MVLDYKIKTLRRLFGPNSFFRLSPPNKRGAAGSRRGGSSGETSGTNTAAGEQQVREPTAYLRAAAKPKVTKGGNGIPRAFFNEQVPRSIRGKAVGSQLFTVHLLEKQKMRVYYGAIRDKMFRRYVERAKSKRLNSDAELIRSLELRLDTILYRSGLVISPMQARVWIAHGHVALNGHKAKRRCTRCRPGDLISIRDKHFDNALKSANRVVELRKIFGLGSSWIAGKDFNCDWLEVDRGGLAVALVRTPTDDECRTITRAALLPYVRDAALNPHAAMRAYR